MMRTIWGDPERYKKTYFPDDFKGKLLPRGRRREHRRGRLLPHHRPHRRRAQRLGPPARHDGSRIGAGRQLGWSPKPPWSAGRTTSPARRSSPSWSPRARARGRRGEEDRARAARLGGQGDRADRQAEGHPLRRQPAEDALRQDHAPPAALDRQAARRSRRTSRRSRTRRSSSSSRRGCKPTGHARGGAMAPRPARRRPAPPRRAGRAAGRGALPASESAPSCARSAHRAP